MGALFGVEAAPVSAARVLELGCGDGGNLLPMALALPDATFVGIDSATGAIARGKQIGDELALRNLTLTAETIERFDLSEPFDFVIAHGVYSWVAPEVRDALLALCASVLSPTGIAYVSYNARPGSALRQSLREMLRFHAGRLEDPHERLHQARSLLSLLIEGFSGKQELGAAMRAHAEQLSERDDDALFHDDLAEINDPVYFHEFAAHAASHGLQYLAEADFVEMQIGVMPDAVAQQLLRIDDPIVQEQYLDFLKGRAFRQTLLCRQEVKIERLPRPEVLERLAVSSPVTASEADSQPGEVTFEGPSGSRLICNEPAVIVALEQVGARWPEAVWIGDLLAGASDGQARTALCEVLLRAYAASLVELHVHPPALTATLGERPVASALARAQARRLPYVTTLRHRSVRVEDELGRHLITLLDGTRNRDALLQEVEQFRRDRGGPVGDDLAEGLERSLEGLAQMGLLVAQTG